MNPIKNEAATDIVYEKVDGKNIKVLTPVTLNIDELKKELEKQVQQRDFMAAQYTKNVQVYDDKINALQGTIDAATSLGIH